MSRPLPPDDPCQWMLKDGFTTTKHDHRPGCYICEDPEFAQMGLPLCKNCTHCAGHVPADSSQCDDCGRWNGPRMPEDMRMHMKLFQVLVQRRNDESPDKKHYIRAESPEDACSEAMDETEGVVKATIDSSSGHGFLCAGRTDEYRYAVVEAIEVTVVKTGEIVQCTQDDIYMEEYGAFIERDGLECQVVMHTDENGVASGELVLLDGGKK